MTSKMDASSGQPRKLFRRREFIRTSLLTAGATTLLGRKVLAGTPAPRVARNGIGREIFIPAPHPGAALLASSFYTRPTGLDLLSIQEILTRSDTVDVADLRYSNDNGRTWTKGEQFPTFGIRPTGKLRRGMRACIVDPVTGRLLHFYLEAILPTDDPLEGFREWVVHYRVSEDGGMTWCVDDEIIQQGAEYDADHPVAGVRRGHTCFMIGDTSSQPIFLADGTLLVPIVISPAGPDGNYLNPSVGYTYSNVAVLRGRWGPDGRHMVWEPSDLIKVDPNLSTRGMDEPTLAALADGRILIVLRGSNDHRPALPGRRWVAYSSDQGRTWTTPRPWTYTSGEDFFSPASSSQLLTHSSGRLFWLGNIIPANPDGNRPRYPFVIGEVDRHSGLLDRQSVRVVDDRGPQESALIAFASGSSREDRETGEIVLNLTRWGENTKGNDWSEYSWTANAYLYRIPVL